MGPVDCGGQGPGRPAMLRVGTTACLSDQTLLKIKYNDFAVRQDPEGYILAASHGTMLLFK